MDGIQYLVEREVSRQLRGGKKRTGEI